MKIELLYEDSQMPLRAHPNDAGMDLYAHLDEDVIIGPGCMYKIGSGVAIQPPKGTFGAMFARSGLSTKQGLRLANGVGE